MKPWLKLTMALVGAGMFCAPAFGANPARPGTVNYIEGEVHLGGQALSAHDVGSIDLHAGEVISTQKGRAEVLLTPGVFLRLGDHSAVQMISPDLTLTQVDLMEGKASVEVDEIHPQNDLEVIDGGVTARMIKTGYYEFLARPATLLVFKGEAWVKTGNGEIGKVKGHREMVLAPGTSANPAKFDARDAEDALYNWSSLRSQYLAEANNEIAGQYYGMANFYPGWYWDPFMWDYTYIGLDPFWSPFGWGFYPPWYGFYGGVYWGGGHWRGGHGNWHGHEGHWESHAGEVHGDSGFHGGGFHGGGGRGR